MADVKRSGLAGSAFSYAIYPLTVGGAVLTMISLVGAGMSYWRVGPLVLLVTALTVSALERCWPFDESWNADQGDQATDVLHLLGNVLVSHGALAGYAALEAHRSALPSLWPASWPLVAQFLCALVVFDFGLYVIHRASHRSGWLWRLHAIHHSSERIYWVNGQRRHLLHEIVEGIPGFLVLGLLGAPSTAVSCAVAAITAHLMLQHANIAYRGGMLRHAFCVAELHRWHHNRDYRAAAGNYGAMLAVWDWLFRTSLHGAPAAGLIVGLSGERPMPRGYLGQLLWPFARAGAPSRDAADGQRAA